MTVDDPELARSAAQVAGPPFEVTLLAFVMRCNSALALAEQQSRPWTANCTRATLRV